MDALPKRHIPQNLLPVLWFVLAVFLIPAAKDADLNPRPIDDMEMLSRKIDSLDLLKQSLKRKGETIAAIEQHQDALRDSLRVVRDNLRAASHALPKTYVQRNPPFSIRKPSNPFDWIIVTTGVIALLSGVMLIIGIARSVRLKRNCQRRIRETFSRKEVKSVADNQEKPAGAYPAAPETALSGSAPSPGIDPISIDRLRQRIDERGREESRDAPRTEEVRPAPPSAVLLDNSESDDVAKRVLEASRNGLDRAAISRKFHLSADHVALILKMADLK